MITEKQFSDSLRTVLLNKGYSFCRIESHLTAIGVPDLYVMTPMGVNWFELKVDRREFSYYDNMPRTDISVKWRPGQQAWAYEHCRLTRRTTYTLVQFQDKQILAIKMSRVFHDNKLSDGAWVQVFQSTSELVEKIGGFVW